MSADFLNPDLAAIGSTAGAATHEPEARGSGARRLIGRNKPSKDRETLEEGDREPSSPPEAHKLDRFA